MCSYFMIRVEKALSCYLYLEKFQRIIVTDWSLVQIGDWSNLGSVPIPIGRDRPYFHQRVIKIIKWKRALKVLFLWCCPKLRLYRIVQLGPVLIICSDVVLTLFYATSYLYVHYIFKGCVVILY